MISQWMQSRRKAIAFFLAITAVFIAVYGALSGASTTVFYLVCFLLGLANGYWALFVTVAAEQFGTNLRATVAISVPNFVRGSVVPLTLAFRALAPSLGLVWSAMIVGATSLVLAFIALGLMRETFGKDLDYLESGA
jgi:hypothetical protein